MRLVALARRSTAFGNDLRIAARRLRGSPWYTATVIGTTALTMTLATAVFTVVDGVLFKPLPYERVVELFDVSGGYSDELRAEHPRGVTNRSGLGISPLDARELQAAVPGVTVGVRGLRAAQQRVGDLRAWAPAVGLIDAQLLDVLGVTPLIGGFSEGDFQTASDAVQPALLSYRTWQTRLGGRTDLVGDSVEIGDPPVRYRVAGVLPEGFVFPSGSVQPDLLAPLVAPPEEPARRARSFAAVARVPAGMSITQVQERFNAVARTARAGIPDRRLNAGMGPWDVWALRPLSTVLASRQQSTFGYIFFAAMALVLLGCVNVSGLVASRNLERSRELSVRRALGARQGDIASLVVAEQVLLLAAGTTVGLLASRPAVALTLGLLPANVNLLREPALDWRVVGFAAVAAILAVALVSLWPLWQGRRFMLASAMGGSSQTVTPARSAGRFVVVSLQVAVGFALTLAGALIVGSLVRVWQSDIGYDPGRLLIIEGTLTATDDSTRRNGLQGFIESVRRLPGVAAAGATNASLLRSGVPGGMWRANTYAVSEGFFDAIPIAVVDGRLPTNEELRRGTPVAAITAGVAAQYFPGERAVGQLLREEGGARNDFSVVGVVHFARYGGWKSEEIGGQVYIPLAATRRFSAVVRMTPSAGPLLQQILDAAPDWPVQLSTAATAARLLHETIRTERFQSWLFGSFASGALMVVCVGVLGLMAFTTRRRTRELAIRMALGARGASILRLILREQLTPIVAGLLAGGLVSIWVERSLRSYLYETPPFDPAIWTAAATAILAFSLAGVLIPARQAAAVDPARVLRGE